MTIKSRIVLAGVGLLALAGFLSLALLVQGGPSPVLRLDSSWHLGLHTFGANHPAWLSTMWVLTHLGDTVTILARDVVGRARPQDPFWAADGPSFPSGHTTNTAW